MRAAATALADAVGDRPVESVTFAVGASLDIASAAAAWDVAVAGTCLQGCRVRWQPASDRLRCFGCGNEYDGRTPDQCPVCGGTGLVVTSAPELTVVDWLPVIGWPGSPPANSHGVLAGDLIPATLRAAAAATQ